MVGVVSPFFVVLCVGVVSLDAFDVACGACVDTLFPRDSANQWLDLRKI